MDDISKALNLPPLDGEVVQPKPVVLRDTSTDKENDFRYARENFYNVIEKGTQALEDMLDIAKSSEHPRAYEVVSTLMKTLVDANKDLVSMAKDREKESSPEETKVVTNNNLFVGSTNELQKMLKDLRSNNE